MPLIDIPLVNLATDIGNRLMARQWRIAIAESCTGGGLAYTLTAIPGSSQWFERGFVTYSNEAKQELLDVPATLIQQAGAVSQEVAQAMVAGVLQHSPANLALSITGVAGPAGATQEKPVGTVWLGFAVRDSGIETVRRQFKGDRTAIRQQTIAYALQTIRQYLR